MSIIPPFSTPATPGSAEVIYPCSDGRPVGETPVHRDNLLYTIEILEEWFAAEPFVYPSGNMFLYYEKGNKRKHVSPDVFVVRGVPKDKPRKAYLLWEEGRAPDMVIEITSESTRDDDENKKLKLYRDLLKVTEYFLFDPFREYVGGQFQGFRLREEKYEPIAPLAGRLPSDVLGLHLEADGEDLRLWDPKTRRRLPNVRERARAAKAEAEAERKRADAEHLRAEEKDLEIERLRREIESLIRRPPAV
ncbi:MAG TPA: Uma2 family endonuclease [Pirellulales bacterium]|jgi:Uma2 family endonuclease|nr:Uma2 family endonuclease [Pirellulales bacterium]